MADLYIDGGWRPARDGGTRQIRCPADGTLVTEVDEATASDTVAAIRAARHAFDHGDWPRTDAAERSDVLSRTAHLLRRDRAEIARAESLDTGKRLVESELDVDDVIGVFDYYATAAADETTRPVDLADPSKASRIQYEPIGVCGLITPWNYPLLQTSWKVAPALAAGNTFVLKPSELTPSSAIRLVALLAEAGLPAGVANLVLGAGPEAGAPLAEHPDVDLLSFTGGLHTGRLLMATAAATVKKVTLELGGKNPNVVFADADWQASVDNALTAVFLHSGQVCSAGTRLIVQADIADDFVTEVVERAGQIKLGGPFDPDARTGPLISAAHRDKVAAYVATGIAEGAVLRCGGGPPSDPELTDGFYYLPTVLDQCRTGMRVVQDESFGPVLTVERFRDEDEAIAFANDTIYGLAGGVWTSDAAKADRVASRLRHGTIWINDFHPYVPQAEWGGFKQSGIGRELGRSGLEEYREAKHVWTNLRPAPSRWFD
ncbi:aldehyde dehydrogenase family protein [Actinopolymorpha pittospori]